MSNPMLEMLNRTVKPSTGGMGNSPMTKLMDFAKLMKGKNPEQMLQNYIRMNNVDESQYQQVAAQARQICDMFGLK